MRKAVSSTALVLMLAAVGCSTNNNPGNGQPTNTPSTMPSATPGASSGSTSTQGPMASAVTTPKTKSERAAATVDAIAVLAADQGYRGRVLGAADPGPQGAALVSTTVAAPGSSTVSTVDTSMQSTPASSNVRIETDSTGNLIVTNALSTSSTVTTTTTTTSTSRVRRFLNHLRGKK